MTVINMTTLHNIYVTTIRQKCSSDKNIGCLEIL